MGGIAVQPPAFLLQRLGQIPVIQGDGGLNPRVAQRGNQPAVKIEPLLVQLPDAFGEDARPGYGEPVGVDAQARQQPEIIGPAPVVIARYAYCIGTTLDLSLASEPVLY